jgi:predicted amidohydrolase
MRIALAQLVSSEDPAANLDQVRQRTVEAAAAGAQLVLFPEATMRCFGRSLIEIAELLDGPWATAVRDLARRNGVVVAVGMFTPSADGRVKNTLLIVGPDVDAHYDKIHLFDAYGFAESDTVAPGHDVVVLDIAGARVGFTICYDVRFPELYTMLADRGAQLICVCASWGAGPGKVQQWELLTRARALDSTTFVAAVDQADPATIGFPSSGNAPTGVGHSVVVSAEGEVLGSLGSEPGLLIFDFDPAEVDAVRKAIPVLTNRRL